MIILCILLVVGYSGKSFGGTLVCKIASAISQIGGGHPTSCASSSASSSAKNPQEPTKACTNKEVSHKVGGNIGVLLMTFEGDGSIVVEEMSDGTYRVTDKSSAAIKAGPNAAGGLDVSVNGKKYGSYGEMGTGRGVTTGQGATYVVNSEKEKNDLVAHLTREKVVDAAGAGVDAAGNHGGKGIGSVGSWIFNGVADTVEEKVFNYTAPEPTEYYYTLGRVDYAGASATNRNPLNPLPIEINPVAPWKGDNNAAVSLTRLAGLRINTKDHTETVYYDTQAALGLESNIDTTNHGGKGAGHNNSTVAATYDSETGELISLETTTDVGAETSTTGRAQELFGDHDTNLDTRFTASVDMTDPSSRKQAQLLMTTLGLPTNKFDGVKPPIGDPGLASYNFYKQARDHGVYTRQTMNKDSSETGFRAAFEVGGGASYTQDRTKFSDGQWYDSSSGEWRTWEGCE